MPETPLPKPPPWSGTFASGRLKFWAMRRAQRTRKTWTMSPAGIRRKGCGGTHLPSSRQHSPQAPAGGRRLSRTLSEEIEWRVEQWVALEEREAVLKQREAAFREHEAKLQVRERAFHAGCIGERRNGNRRATREGFRRGTQVRGRWSRKGLNVDDTLQAAPCSPGPHAACDRVAAKRS